MVKNVKRIRSDEFDFPLAHERIAQHPRPFEEQKLLVYDRATKRIDHTLFPSLSDLLRPGDLIVANDSRVISAAVWRKDGKQVLFIRPNDPGFTEIQAVCPSRTKVDQVQELVGARLHIKQHVQGSVFLADLMPEKNYAALRDYLQENGTVPIPPYLKRRPEERDATDYQTVFAKDLGSIACPTAGLHFDQQLIGRLGQCGVELTTITLHVGYGTFKGFKSEFVDEHIPDAEDYRVSASSVRRIGLALREGRRVIAIGTTVTRVLESIPEELMDFERIDADLTGQTTLFVYPPFNFRVITGLITNFASPRNPVMSLAAAFIGLDELKRIYEATLEKDYSFYSYGDALLAF